MSLRMFAFAFGPKHHLGNVPVDSIKYFNVIVRADFGAVTALD